MSDLVHPPNCLSNNAFSDFCNTVENEIIKEANRRDIKVTTKEELGALNRDRFTIRTGIDPISRSNMMREDLHDYFVPEFCIENAADLADAVSSAIFNRTYQTVPAVQFAIPKADGSLRYVMQFSIVDAAISNIVFRSVRERNIANMSEFSYAYHPHKSVPHAIIALRNFRPQPGMFAVQIDFKSFFDNIDHNFLFEKLKDHNFDIANYEYHVIRAFMRHEFATFEDYAQRNFSRRDRGVAQGATISLFLANLACNDLDHAVAPIADFYARFADDTLCFSKTHDDAQSVAALICEHSERMGVQINWNKSPGITIFGATDENIARVDSIEFLGYKYENERLWLSERTENRLEKYISKLINVRLVHYLKFGFNKSRCSIEPHPYDWDLVGLICELNGFLYGGHSDSDIRKYINNETKLDSLNGVMRNYCLIEDGKQLRKLDGFTLNTIRRAMSHRNRILNKHHGVACPTPSNKQLLDGKWFDERAWRESTPPDLRLGSFVRAWDASYRFHVNRRGRSPNHGAIGAVFHEYDPLSELDEFFMGLDDELA